MATYRTPGVYVQEISTLPPSVAEVSTAIPAFIGYTKKHSGVARINTLLEYETLFGKAYPTGFSVQTPVDSDVPLGVVVNIEGEADQPEFLMYYSVSHYFQNGGGSCYIVSIGNYEVGNVKTDMAKADFEDGLNLLEKEDEPTLILLTDAVRLKSASDYYDLCKQALAQCNKLKDRFAILDVRKAAAEDVNGLDEFRDNIGIDNLMYGAVYHPYLKTVLNYQFKEDGVQIEGSGKLDSTKATNTSLYNQVKTALTAQRVVLPPSAAVAGVYARVDRERGVWKAPANVSLRGVIGPVAKITQDDQERLNVDPDAGKSINAIRAFTGKGTLIWGARTLAGNDNEWRYVSVRRLFIMIEESTQKSTAFAVFEPNDATTWLKVKGMVESFLYGLWERGALAGSTPEAAYFANVGLGKTMTQQDILEGRMIVEIGIAAVRPAEFIVIRFTHKLQEA